MPSPTLTRRALLAGIPAAAASTALAISIAPAARADDACSLPLGLVTPENPELVKLGNELPAIEAEYVDAYASRYEIVRKWSTHWPLAPDEISSVMAKGDWDSPDERTLDDFGLKRLGEERSRKVVQASTIGSELDDLRRTLRRKRRDPFAPINWRGVMRTPDELDAPLSELETKHNLALAYEAEKARVLELSGFIPARDREEVARKALAAHVASIMAQPETTMTGIIIKAQALGAWGKVEPFFRQITVGVGEWGPALAAAVLRMASGEVA